MTQWVTTKLRNISITEGQPPIPGSLVLVRKLELGNQGGKEGADGIL